MAELRGVNLGHHLSAIVTEYRANKTIYGHPQRKIFLGYPGFDFSVDFHDRHAATLLGPASGPHTQMAQNIILSFLGGSRIIELKTIQILDRLEIPRPCIDVRNVGYNIEWSQELRLEESMTEYVTAWVLLKILEEMELLEIAKDDPFYHTVFDISAGYDLKGISSPQVHRWLQTMQDASAEIEQALSMLPLQFAHYRKLPIDPHISNSVTLSTFHGCPREEIEAIVEHLIREHGFHVIVKMNPTLLGHEAVRQLLQEDLGYQHIALDPAAFENDLQFDEGVAMMQRLERFAQRHNRKVGAKFTNTLVVKNTEDIFKDEIMYLSGAPLHVISMNAMHRFRTAVGDHLHVSFSAGITKHNFVEAVRCNMKPVTTCTDLLMTGGYTRLFDYLKNLKIAMEEAGCRVIDDFIVKSAGIEHVKDVNSAGVINANQIVPALVDNPRYHFKMNHKPPPKIDSHLTLFDCITCNKCLPVCPNAANFSIPTGTKRFMMTNYRIDDGEFVPVAGEEFALEKKDQIANLADFCNECGDCDTYCPEYGGPFIEKPRFFLSQASYSSFESYDGFWFPAPHTMVGRIKGVEYQISFKSSTQEYRWQTPEVALTIDHQNQLVGGRIVNRESDGLEINMHPFYIMRALLDGIMLNPDSYAPVLLRKDAQGVD